MYEGEMVNKLEARIAPSGEETDTGTSREMMELAGRAKPSTPLNRGDSGSESTEVAAAREEVVQRTTRDKGQANIPSACPSIS